MHNFKHHKKLRFLKLVFMVALFLLTVFNMVMADDGEPEVFTVSDVSGFIAAIGSDRIIQLEPGTITYPKLRIKLITRL